MSFEGIPRQQSEAKKIKSLDVHLGWSPLYTAVIHKQKDVVLSLLKHGADANVQTRLGETPLHQASLNNLMEISRGLLSHRANPNLQQSDGDTPLHHACSQGHSEMVKLLLEHGASYEIKNYIDQKTPLQYAIEKNHLEAAKMIRIFSRKSSSCCEDSISSTNQSSLLRVPTETDGKFSHSDPELQMLLADKGLEQFFSLFAKHGIRDRESLCEDTLRKIGVKIGFRLQLLPPPQMTERNTTCCFTKEVIKRETLESWLEKLNLSCYLENFKDAGFEDSNLLFTNSKLVTDEVLRNEIGICKFGHRHRILGALSESSWDNEKSIIWSDSNDCVIL